MGTMTVNAPSITPLCKPIYYKGRQSIDSRTQIEITCDSPRAVVYFSVNGRTPDPFETWNLNTVTLRYTKPFVLKGGDKPRTVKAVAVIEKLKQKSPVVTKSFNVAVHPASPKQRKRTSTAEINNDGKLSNKAIDQSEENPVEIAISPTFEQENEVQDVLNLNDGVMVDEEINGDTLPSADAGLGELDEMYKKTDEPADNNFSIVHQEEQINDDPKLDNEVDQCVKVQDEENSAKDLLVHQHNTYQEKTEGNNSNGAQPSIDEQLNIQEDAVDEMETSDLIHAGVDTPQEALDQTAIHTDKQQILSEIENNTDLYSEQPVDLPMQPPVHIQQEDKQVQATTDTDLKATQTEPEIDQPNKVLPSRNPPLQRAPKVQMVSKRVGNELQEESKACQTLEEEKADCKEQGCQTEDRQRLNGISKYLQKGSPGRGYWRQQIDHISHQLKTEAYNNPDFQEMISQPSLAQINHVNVHEGLDELILVINIAIHRPTISIHKD